MARKRKQLNFIVPLHIYQFDIMVSMNQLRYLKERNMPFMAHVEKKNDSILYITDKQ